MVRVTIDVGGLLLLSDTNALHTTLFPVVQTLADPLVTTPGLRLTSTAKPRAFVVENSSVDWGERFTAFEAAVTSWVPFWPNTSMPTLNGTTSVLVHAKKVPRLRLLITPGTVKSGASTPAADAGVATASASAAATSRRETRNMGGSSYGSVVRPAGGRVDPRRVTRPPPPERQAKSTRDVARLT